VKKMPLLLIVFVVAVGIGLIAWQNAAALNQTPKQPAPAPAKKAAAPAATDPCADTPASQPGTPPTIVVEIRPDPAPPADPEDGEPSILPNTVCVKTTEQIEWKWAGPGTPAFTVVFTGRAKPFKGRYFYRGKPSGKPAKAANLKKRYKYSVAVEGYGVVDPDVIIR
jgi:hypothetical protein